MKWTKKLPQEEGYYWINLGISPKADKEVVCVCKISGEFCADGEPVKNIKFVRWYGPLKEPKGEAKINSDELAIEVIEYEAYGRLQGWWK